MIQKHITNIEHTHARAHTHALQGPTRVLKFVSQYSHLEVTTAKHKWKQVPDDAEFQKNWQSLTVTHNRGSIDVKNIEKKEGQTEFSKSIFILVILT